MTETTLQRQILDALRRTFGWAQWYRVNTGRRGRVRFGMGPGTPDIYGIVNGRAVHLEVKTPTGVVSAEQTAWMLEASAAGAHCEVVRSVADALAAVQRATDNTGGQP